jgi:hypothetical protein
VLKSLSYGKKNRLLVISGGILLLLVYVFSIQRTIEAYREVSALEVQAGMAANAPAEAGKLEKQIERMNELAGVSNGSADVQQELLGMITGYCQQNGTALREFPETVRNEENDLTIETSMFTVEGRFSELLKLEWLLEREKGTGKISSARFFSRKDPKTKTIALNVTIYLQNIKRHY